MTDPVSSRPTAPRKGILSARRLALTGSVAGLAALVLFAGPQWPSVPQLPAFQSQAQAQAVAQAPAQPNATGQTQVQVPSIPMRPASFADLVEKVKPAVFAVRVKVGDAGEPQQFSGESPFPPGSQLDRFFRRWGFGDQEGMEQRRGERDGRGERDRRGERRRGGRPFSMAQGSGFFISADGYAVTNNHVVARGETVEISTDDGKTYSARVIGNDPRTDIALLKVDGRSDFPYVPLSEKLPRIGDWVIAVGNPFGLGGSVTAGIVSASGRDIGAGPYDDFIQIDASVNRGNSGGPTFDTEGNVIGVNTAIYSPSGGNVGIAFAIPAETVRQVVTQLRDKGTVSRGWIGVQIQAVTAEIAESLGLKEVGGALVAEPQPDSPAAKADIRAGDVIVSVDGERVRDARELARRIGAQPPGATVRLGIFRDGGERTINLTLGTLPDEPKPRAERRPRGGEREPAPMDVPQLGLSLAPAGSVSGAGNDGVVVTDVEQNGPAAERGVRTGDVIIEVGGQPVSNPGDVRKAIEGARRDGKGTVLMRVRTGEASRFVALPVGRG